MHWTLFVDPAQRSGSENMGIDYALLQAVGVGAAFLRLYRWDPPCLSFGCNEPAKTKYDYDEIKRLGLDTVRRPTGGRAVWHQSELTYAVAAPLETFGTLRETYLAIHKSLVAALSRVGASVSLAPRPNRRTPSPSSGSCFASPVQGEIIAQDKKLVGSAQLRERFGFLQHGSILLRDDQDTVSDVTSGTAPQPNATSLSSVLGRPVEFAEVADALSEECRERWNGDWESTSCSPVGTGHHKFADTAWTWRR